MLGHADRLGGMALLSGFPITINAIDPVFLLLLLFLFLFLFSFSFSFLLLLLVWILKPRREGELRPVMAVLHYDERKVAEKDDHIPKGYLAVLVGRGDDQQRRRFVIPVIYVNHPLFVKLLKESEEEYGFDHKGPIIIPCRVDQFLTVQCMIYHDNAHNHHLPVSCFRL